MESQGSHDEEQRRIDELYDLLKEERMKYYLDDMENRTTCHTPVHEAAAIGMSHWALEVANLKPSLARKLNHEGLSPMHLALNNGHCQTVRALMAFDSSLIRVKGRDLVTPLHYAAKLEQTELLAEFLSACPSSVEDLTSRCETAMHVAVRNERQDACKVLLGWIIRKKLEEILSWKDEDGNTVLHVATLTNQPEVTKLLIGYVKVNAKNFRGLTALDLCYEEGHRLDLNVEVRKILCVAKARRALEVCDSLTGAGYLRETKLFLVERWDRKLSLTDANSRAKYRAELRSMTMVVAVLIATATYQGLLSPPGGYWQDDSTTTVAITGGIYAPSPAVAAAPASGPQHTAGKMIMGGQEQVIFLFLNSAAFVTSVMVIIITLFGVESSLMLGSPVALAMGTYILAVNQVNQTVTNNFTVIAIALAVSLVITAAPLAMIMSQLKFIKRKVRLDAPGRRLGGFI